MYTNVMCQNKITQITGEAVSYTHLKVTSVTALGNGLYKVNFIDMGIKGNRTLKIIDVNGTLKFDAIK